MKCPACAYHINLVLAESRTWQNRDVRTSGLGYHLGYGHCPSCDQLIVLLRRGPCQLDQDGETFLTDIQTEEVIYPWSVQRPVAPEVPDIYRQDFGEACAVVTLSPKASAALSRRMLQQILRDVFRIKPTNLADAIEVFVKRKDIPSHLAQAVDAVRNIGNFAAHPLKDSNTGAVVDVEPGEAEWLLDVIEALFDVAFVQPARMEAQKQQLNRKLQSLGKPVMK
ncbi:MAG: DUF4145 domain-containing protein [Chloroflexaceae bacterium]|nr:DUF4145 domain-containing protein [Chloroflexaceae bacterium]